MPSLGFYKAIYRCYSREKEGEEEGILVLLGLGIGLITLISGS
jgi:hypothetical protein